MRNILLLWDVSLDAEESLTLCYGLTVGKYLIFIIALLCFHGDKSGPNILLLSYR